MLTFSILLFIGFVLAKPRTTDHVLDHGTIGPREFWGLQENILRFKSKKEFIGQT